MRLFFLFALLAGVSLFMFFGSIFVWSSSPNLRNMVRGPDHSASVEFSNGLRLQVDLLRIGPFLAEYYVTERWFSPNGKQQSETKWADHGGFRKVALYRGNDGCLTTANRFSATQSAYPALLKGCTVTIAAARDRCLPPAFDPDTRNSKKVDGSAGYLGMFEFNMWRVSPTHKGRIWQWSFHHSIDEPECFEHPGG